MAVVEDPATHPTTQLDVSAVVHGALAGRDVEVLQPPVLWPTTVDMSAVVAALGPVLTADVSRVTLNNVEVRPGDEPGGTAPGHYVAVTTTYSVTDPSEIEPVVRGLGWFAYATDRDGSRQLTLWLPAWSTA
ncbi:MAG TPA: hypothetical protein VFZ83_03605 [Acidimicrobiia bacterium]|nr:hypothetical protein [Acidimicrobiia bacterium]